MKGIGIDILHVPRLAALLSRQSRSSNSYGHALSRRILSTQERDMMPSSQDEILRFLATRWVVKEAVYKADNSLTWKEVSVLYKDGRPILSGVDGLVSVSHDGDYVVGMVVLI